MSSAVDLSLGAFSEILDITAGFLQEGLNVGVVKHCLNLPLPINFSSLCYFDSGTRIFVLAFILGRFRFFAFTSFLLTITLFIRAATITLVVTDRRDVDHSNRGLNLVLGRKERRKIYTPFFAR